MTAHTVLAMDASSEGCSLALQVGEQRTVRESKIARAHAQSLLPMVDELLTEADISLNAVDYIALVNGPGSFTGIRIALSVAQGLAYGASLPLVCVSSLESLVFSHVSDSTQAADLYVCALDARMGEVYWASFTASDTRGFEFHCKPAVCAYDVFNHALAEFTREGKRIVGLGPGFAIADIDLAGIKQVLADAEPHAVGVLEQLSRIDNITELQQAADVIEPLYLRNEIAWKKRTRQRTSPLV